METTNPKNVVCAALGVLIGLLIGIACSGPSSSHRRGAASFKLKAPAPDWEFHRHVLGDAFVWARQTVPFFESSDEDVTQAYYYRWRLFWMHLKRTPRWGYVLTEFLNPVPWAGPHGTINCPFGHQSAEARWVRDAAVLDNYSLFWFRHPKADRRYTWWPAHSALERFKLDGRLGVLRELRAHLEREYDRWVERSVLPATAALMAQMAAVLV